MLIEDTHFAPPIRSFIIFVTSGAGATVPGGNETPPAIIGAVDNPAGVADVLDAAGAVGGGLFGG